MDKRAVSPLILTVYLILSGVANAGNDLNLVGYWKLDETFSRIASDSSGNRNDGKLIGGVDWAPADGKLKGAVSFDGSTNSRIEIPAAGITPAAGTVALWVYLTEPQSKAGRSGYRFLFGYGRRPNRIQLYMDNNDTQLDLGLGDQHRRHENITNLSTEAWYHIALTWDGSNYVVYVDSVERAGGTYSGLTSLPSLGDIGNNGDESRQAFHGLIDDVIIFDRAMSKNEAMVLYNPSSARFASEPTLVMLLGEVRKAEAIVKEQKPREAIAFLEEKIDEYEKWEEKNPNNTELPYKALSSDLYFLLAKAKEAAGAPIQDVIGAYKQSISPLMSSRPNSISALSWLFENISAKDYIAIVKKYMHHSNDAPRNIYYIAKHFESDGNWPAFKLFLDAVFSEAEDPIASARSVERGLSENGIWGKKYLEYCRSKPQLTEYALEKDCEVAEGYITKEDFKKAAKIYRDITKRYGSGQHKSVLELKVCECLFKDGEYQSAISELDRFITRNKATNRNLTKEAILTKGRCYIQLGEIDKALDEFLTLVIEYPESGQAPEVSYFLGYSYMLQGKLKEATEAFNIVVQDYPKSSYANKAHMYLTRLNNIID